MMAARTGGHRSVDSVVQTIEAGADDAVEAAVRVLLDGGAVVLPTDTVYGVAVAASVPQATARLFALKDRPDAVPLAVLVDSLDQARQLCDVSSPAVGRLVDRWWPGPLTVVLPRRADVVVELGGDGSSIGVRCPDHDLVRALAREVGPLATTSANRHGEPTPTTAADVLAVLGDGVALVIDGGPCHGVASTVVDGRDASLVVLRAGPISPEQVAAAALP
jgi:L-threonylcarbamoyladenylate synthase